MDGSRFLVVDVPEAALGAAGWPEIEAECRRSARWLRAVAAAIEINARSTPPQDLPAHFAELPETARAVTVETLGPLADLLERDPSKVPEAHLDLLYAAFAYALAAQPMQADYDGEDTPDFMPRKSDGFGHPG